MTARHIRRSCITCSSPYIIFLLHLQFKLSLHFSSFNFHSFIFFLPLCFFFLFRFVTFRSALSRQCCAKHASSEITLQCLSTHIPPCLPQQCKINLCFCSSTLACNFLFPLLFKHRICHSQLFIGHSSTILSPS